MATLPIASDDNKLDARIVKTLASIEDAFFTLLEQKDYNDITVQDILTHADINRTTFYKYYSNKDDLAGYMIESIKRDFFEPILNKRFSSSWEEFVKALPLFTTDETHYRLGLLWKINTPKINLKNDIYLLIRQRYMETANKPTSADDDMVLQGHLYASFCIAMTEYGLNGQPVNDHNKKHYNIKRVFERIMA